MTGSIPVIEVCTLMTDNNTGHQGLYTTGPNGCSSDQLREGWSDQWNWLGDRRWTSVMRSLPKPPPLHDGWTDRHPAITQRSSTSNPRQSAVGNIAHGGPTSVLPTDGTQRKKQNGQWLEPSTFWYSLVVNQRWRFGAYPDPTAGRPLVNHRSPEVPTVEPGSFQRSCDPTVKPPLRRWEGGVENPHQLTNLNQSKNVARWCTSMTGSITVIEVCTLMTNNEPVIKVQPLMTGLIPVIKGIRQQPVMLVIYHAGLVESLKPAGLKTVSLKYLSRRPAVSRPAILRLAVLWKAVLRLQLLRPPVLKLAALRLHILSPPVLRLEVSRLAVFKYNY
ncbi:hypothetical protein PCANC_14773 [Puccinia coronata f. sp. avenae]|uniref:Uncharacterized protein n=1 Tax=Puccinia coronata f. sp. avenae TaxID=200324 RepID=A0A2N5SNW0_9BASI|nr:hypothetical protein PCANC_14773 [Puccinia coronata f. sp. avenae]